MGNLAEHVMRVVNEQHIYYTSADREYWIEFQPEYTDVVHSMENAGLIETAQEVVLDGKNYMAQDGCVWIRKKAS